MENLVRLKSGTEVEVTDLLKRIKRVKEKVDFYSTLRQEFVDMSGDYHDDIRLAEIQTDLHNEIYRNLIAALAEHAGLRLSA
jgi:hypothetical protein